MKSEQSKSINKKRKFAVGRIYITTRKNTHVTLTDSTGALVLYTGSCGSVKNQQGQQYKHTRKHKPQATQVLLHTVGQIAKDKFGMSFVKIIISGDGNARDISQMNHLVESGLQVIEFIDATGIPHGGCRRKKAPSK